jgi:hypothetical protein
MELHTQLALCKSAFALLVERSAHCLKKSICYDARPVCPRPLGGASSKHTSVRRPHCLHKARCPRQWPHGQCVTCNATLRLPKGIYQQAPAQRPAATPARWQPTDCCMVTSVAALCSVTLPPERAA